jgi:hypothetical protein
MQRLAGDFKRRFQDYVCGDTNVQLVMDEKKRPV